MKFINIAKKQIQNNNLFEVVEGEYSNFFAELFENFGNKDAFYKEFPVVYKKLNLQEVENNIFQIQQTALQIYPQIEKLFVGIFIPNIITYIDCMTWDGHSVMLDSIPHTFFNLTLMSKHHFKQPRFDKKVHCAHEIAHSLHYNYSPDFYPANTTNEYDKLLCKLYSEGIATYISDVLTEKKSDDIYWFGLSEEGFVNRWIDNCENRRYKFLQLINHVKETSEANDDLTSEFFSFSGYPETDYLNSRLGYYYGSEIVKSISDKYSIKELLSLSREIVEAATVKYFS